MLVKLLQRKKVLIYLNYNIFHLSLSYSFSIESRYQLMHAFIFMEMFNNHIMLVVISDDDSGFAFNEKLENYNKT